MAYENDYPASGSSPQGQHPKSITRDSEYVRYYPSIFKLIGAGPAESFFAIFDNQGKTPFFAVPSI